MINPSSSGSKHQRHHGQTSIGATSRTSLKIKIKQMVAQTRAERVRSIKENVLRHENNLKRLFSMIEPVILGRESLQNEGKVNMLSLKMNNPICKFNGFSEGIIEKDQINNVDIILSTESIKLLYKEKLPPYVSWIYAARNVQMAEDQSVLGKYQIYHDKIKDETVICSDSEEEILSLEDVKHDFTDAEDQILWMIFEEYGSTREALNFIKEMVKTNDFQIQNRYKELKEKSLLSPNHHCEDCNCRGCETHLRICLKKSLNASLEFLGNIFCRQCLIFDCTIHDTYQPLIYPDEKQPIWSKHQGDRKPCSDECYLLVKDVMNSSENLAQGHFQYRPMEEDSTFPRNETLNSNDEERHRTYLESLQSIVEHTSRRLTISSNHGHRERGKGIAVEQRDLTNEIEFNNLSNSTNVQANEVISDSNWTPLEKGLYLKGVEIFGENSCLIASNLLPGLKTCLEVAMYMFANADSTPHRSSVSSSMMDINQNINAENMVQEMPTRSRSTRKKGKPKRFTSSRKSAGLPFRWRRIAYRKNLRNKQYTPCECSGPCGKDCPCLLNKTCCEKYCGCLKLCNNRFRGCYCSKSQCRSRLCPCYASNRECDPDVCRNCWVSCSHGSQGESSERGENQCENMNILLGKKKRILLARSNITGWGVFAKNSIGKNVCLGEYTGELINQDEAEKRGKLYHRINNSYLFNLNDQWVIDARRQGNKLKFANHSSKPNCYLKVMLVAGNHRVGIYAKENIEAGDEIFYEYYYELDSAPSWALPPKSRASKKNELSTSHGRAKKHQSSE